MFFQEGSVGVTYFIVLLNFAMGLKYKDEFQRVVTLKDSFQFSYKRIKSLSLYTYFHLTCIAFVHKKILYPIFFLCKLFFNTTSKY